MKPRLTALLATLLAFFACFGVPVTRAATARIACEIVWEHRERRVELALPTRVPPPPAAWATAAPPDHLRTRLLDRALFQRPPPALSL